MILISHRANLNGKNKLTENSLDQIKYCISIDINVEIDVWMINQEFFLGHDEPQYKINFDFLKNESLWFIWTYPGVNLLPNSIAVMPEIANYSHDDLRQCYAICTDIPMYYKNILS